MDRADAIGTRGVAREFVGAVLDGPLRFRNVVCPRPFFDFEIPEGSLPFYERAVELTRQSRVQSVLYRWNPLIGGWHCQPLLPLRLDQRQR